MKKLILSAVMGIALVSTTMVPVQALARVLSGSTNIIRRPSALA